MIDVLIVKESQLPCSLITAALKNEPEVPVIDAATYWNGSKRPDGGGHNLGDALRFS